MLKWLFSKRIKRAKALESYLSHFDEGQLAYLKNLTLMGLLPSCRTDFGLPLHSRILLCAYIHAEWLVARGELEATPASRSGFRASYNMKLARDVAGLKSSGAKEFFSIISLHKLPEPDINSEQEEERLGDHSTILDRIFADPVRASTLPELEAIGEGTAWLRFDKPAQ
jgi:hypothetical protein